MGLNSILSGLGAPRRVFGGNSGYVGYSKSKRAVSAEENGLRNKSQFDKNFVSVINSILLEYDTNPITLTQLRKDIASITPTEWHHTSMYGNKTLYYSPETIAKFYIRHKQARVYDPTYEKLRAQYNRIKREVGDLVMSQIPWYNHNNTDIEIKKAINYYDVDWITNPRYYIDSNGTSIVSPPLGIDLYVINESDSDDIKNAKKEYNSLKKAAFDSLPTSLIQEGQRLSKEYHSYIKDYMRYDYID